MLHEAIAKVDGRESDGLIHPAFCMHKAAACASVVCSEIELFGYT